MAWYKSWFNSLYYHILYQQRDEKEAEQFLDRLISYLKPADHSRILDLACGKGRHSVYLNGKGFEVTGVDLSLESIQYCQQFENESLSFFVHDMRKLFRVNDFDFVLNLFTSFGYFENEREHQAAIKNACIALRKQGKLVIDFLNINYVRTHLVTNSVVNMSGIEFHIQKRIEEGFLFKEIRFNDKGQNFHFTEKVAALELKDFEKFLVPCGMKINMIFGDYDLHPFEMTASPRMILVAEKL